MVQDPIPDTALHLAGASPWATLDCDSLLDDLDNSDS